MPGRHTWLVVLALLEIDGLTLWAAAQLVTKFF
jgi:hypothetical protein